MPLVTEPETALEREESLVPLTPPNGSAAAAPVGAADVPGGVSGAEAADAGAYIDIAAADDDNDNDDKGADGRTPSAGSDPSDDRLEASKGAVPANSDRSYGDELVLLLALPGPLLPLLLPLLLLLLL